MAETRPLRGSGGYRSNKHKKLQWNIGGHFNFESKFKKKNPGWYFTTHIISGKTHTVAGTNPSFVGPEAHIIVVALLKKKNTKLGTKLNIYLEWEVTKYYAV